ncbi:MAG TPA: enoyl-CoA hydratase-related protein [Thermoleophilaceae bacterium]|nr:enoyl-CoA hydratase-related protein [Thermoleophilaceae bacterium]
MAAAERGVNAEGGPVVRVERRAEVAWVTLDVPERMNAYDLATARELIAALDKTADAGVVAITGTGRAFCAGGYLANLAEASETELRSLFQASLDLYDTIRRHPRPVIAAVNGAAFGGGNELVVACDLAIAAESARFGQTGPRVGSAPVLGGTNMLALIAGEKRAKEISLLCRPYDARQAHELGMVNAVVADAELEAEVGRWADELLALSPRYLEIAKISSNVWWDACRGSFLSGLGMLAQAAGSEDMREGAQAFLEKRKPRFPGRAPREDA